MTLDVMFAPAIIDNAIGNYAKLNWSIVNWGNFHNVDILNAWIGFT